MRRLLILASVVVLAWPAAARADRERRAGTLADVIERVLEDQTLGLVVLDTSRIDVKTVPEYVWTLLGVPGEPARNRERFDEGLREFRKAGGKQWIAVFSLADMGMEAASYNLIPIADAGSVGRLEKFFKSRGPFPVVHRVGDVLFAGSEAAWKRVHDVRPAPRPELAAALAAVDADPIGLVLLPTADTKRAFEENAPTLPKELGGAPITSITRGVQWAALVVDLQPRLSLRLIVQSPDAKAARTLADCIDRALSALGEDADLRQAFGNHDVLARKLTPEIHGSRLTLEVNDEIIKEILQPLAGHATRASSSRMDVNNLKQIGLAMHNYYDVHRTLPPPAIYSKDGKPLLSWRVALLPFLGQKKLYEQFHLDEPWDSEHNKKLIEKLPATYRSLSRKAAPGKTVYQVVVGDATLFRGPKGVTFREVTDGTSKTIMVLQTDVAHAVDWTRPEDIRDNPKLVPADVVGRANRTFAATLADGAVKIFSTTIDPKMFRALLTRAGGETIDFSKLP